MPYSFDFNEVIATANPNDLYRLGVSRPLLIEMDRRCTIFISAEAEQQSYIAAEAYRMRLPYPHA